MARTLDRFEFFGVDPRGIPRRHRFVDGYVPLTLNSRNLGDDSTVTAGARADQALGGLERALVRGVAGSGKSTLLRWVGVDAAHAAAGSEPTTVPFLVELVRFAAGRLPDLDEVVARTLRPSMPDGWVHRMLASGRVLLLLDGLDEVRPRERERLEDWVDEHLAAHPGVRCLVTTRPTVVAEQWWADRGFQPLDLLPMSRHSIEQYVRGWHDVARSDQPDTAAGAETREWLDGCERDLLATLSNRPALRGMSANPLLCGLLCALHLERGEHLPENRKQIYDAALELLLERWPHLRRRQRAVGRGEPTDQGPDDPDTEIDLRLTSEELVKLLQRLAFWLVANRRSVLAADVARYRVTSCMFGLRGGDEDPDRVLRYLAHQSGLLRELPDGSLEFVHRTFHDHLAAKEVVDESNLDQLLENADKPHWHDVVVMTGAHARPKERTRILVDLLERGRSDGDHRETLYLLAAAILEQTTVLPQESGSPDVRALVTEAMAELIPPRTPAAADQLATTGPFVLDLMPSPAGLTAAQAALVVRAAARIAARWNPPGAVEKILQFAVEPSSVVINELLEAWGRLGDYEAYARDVLGEIDFSRFTVHLQNGHRIEHIAHLRTITDLTLHNNVMNLAPLADLPELRRLVLNGNAMTSLRPLARSRSLRVLVLNRCSSMAGNRPVDLSPLRDLPLRRLVISGLTTKVDLAGLAGAELGSLRLSGAAPRSSATPTSLPDGLWVRHLSVPTQGRPIRFTGVTGIRSILLGWLPDDDQLAALAELPELRRLVLWQVPPGTPTPTLPGVRVSVCPAGTG